MTYLSDILALTPLAHWILGEPSGTNANDSTANNRDGTYNGPTLGVAGPIYSLDTAASFDGTNDRVEVPATGLDTGDVTVIAWIKTSTVAKRQIVSRWNNGSTNQRWTLTLETTGRPYIYTRNTGGTFHNANGPSSIADGAWHMVAATITSTGLAVYVDGASVGTASRSGTMSGSTQELRIGSSFDPADFFNGPIGQVSLYGSVLTGPQIAALYAAGHTWFGAMASETDTALAGTTTVGAAVTGALASETDTGLAGSVVSGTTVTGALASETDTGLAGSVVAGFVIPGALASETDTALTGTTTTGAVVTGALASETDTALAGALGAGLVIPGALATETDTARRGTVFQPNPTNQGDGNGRDRSAYATFIWEPAVVAPPEGEPGGETTTALTSRNEIAAHAYTGVSETARPFLTGHSTKTRLARRTRILVAGRDVTFLGGMATPEPTYSLISPLLYGSGSIDFPQYPAFLWGTAAIPAWLKPGAPVLLQRVNELGVVTGTSYRGNLGAIDIEARDLSFELRGEASGRASYTDRPPRVARKRNSLEFWWDSLIRDLRLPVGNSANTGIVLQNRGGTDNMAYANDLSAQGAKRGGAIYTCMPNPDGEYRVVQKDKTTIHATVYFDDAHTKPKLRRDPAEEPNVMWATAVSPSGRRIRFADGGVLAEQRPLDYPNNDGSSFGEGTVDADTDSGGGVTAMIARLTWTGYLDAGDRPGGYDADVTAAIEDLQERAGLNVTGNMNENTWAALYDTELSGYSITGYQIRPAIQRAKVRRYDRTGSGAVIGPNPDYDPNVLPVHATKDYGTGLTKNKVMDLARKDLHEAEASNWVGSIEFHTGGLIDGEHTPGDAIGSLMEARQLKPGMNLWAPLFDGGTLLHVAGIEVAKGEQGRVIVTAQVDTRFRDTLEVSEIIKRNRESRRSPARQWAESHRSSGKVNDVVSEWDSNSGYLPDDIELQGLRWTVIGVPAGQEGTVKRIRLLFDNPCEYAVALFGKKIEATKLDNRMGNPLSVVDEPHWEDAERLEDLDQNHWLLGKWGDNEQPCGYWPVAKDQGGELNPRGKFVDDAGIDYFCFDDASLFLAIYPAQDTKLLSGQVLQNLMEAGS